MKLNRFYRFCLVENWKKYWRTYLNVICSKRYFTEWFLQFIQMFRSINCIHHIPQDYHYFTIGTSLCIFFSKCLFMISIGRKNGFEAVQLVLHLQYTIKIQICSNLQEDLVKSKVGSSESQLFYIKRFTWIFFSHVWHCKNSSDVGCKKEWCTLLEI